MKTSIDFLISEVHDLSKVKIIVFSRHGDKTPENHITLNCLKGIIENGMEGLDPRINVLQLGSACIRSTETAGAAALWISINGGKISKYLPVDARLGSDKLFQDLYTPEIKEQMKANDWKNYEALSKANLDGLINFKIGVAAAVEKMFKKMRFGDIALSVSHSPTVEVAFNCFADPDQSDEKMQIYPCDGIILIQMEIGKGLCIFAYR
ncbi:MAG: hypothetical protein NTY31_00370 [Candidatus Falkowbacteria bacterium]|nr:hypothetical protein [Candidatus Falkowbacteria bacterium]